MIGAGVNTAMRIQFRPNDIHYRRGQQAKRPPYKLPMFYDHRIGAALRMVGEHPPARAALSCFRVVLDAWKPLSISIPANGQPRKRALDQVVSIWSAPQVDWPVLISIRR
jgi:hypothetical protein